MDIHRICLSDKHNDLYSRKIIAWVLSDTLEAKWVVEAIEKAKKERKVDKPKVMHSDRGIQYTCDAYREAQPFLRDAYNVSCQWSEPYISAWYCQ